MRKTCLICEKPRVPKQYYAFCSMACATKWAIWTVQDYNEVAYVWCRRHGWQSIMDPCSGCGDELCRRCGHERRRHGEGHDTVPELNGCQWSDFHGDEDDCKCPAFVGPKYGVAE